MHVEIIKMKRLHYPFILIMGIPIEGQSLYVKDPIIALDVDD